MFVKHTVYLKVPFEEEAFYVVPVIAASNYQHAKDMVYRHAIQALADEYGTEDPDIHKLILEKAVPLKMSIESLPTTLMVTDIYGIDEIKETDVNQARARPFNSF